MERSGYVSPSRRRWRSAQTVRAVALPITVAGEIIITVPAAPGTRVVTHQPIRVMQQAHRTCAQLQTVILVAMTTPINVVTTAQTVALLAVMKTHVMTMKLTFARQIRPTTAGKMLLTHAEVFWRQRRILVTEQPLPISAREQTNVQMKVMCVLMVQRIRAHCPIHVLVRGLISRRNSN